jgi:diguanylate cyclase
LISEAPANKSQSAEFEICVKQDEEIVLCERGWRRWREGEGWRGALPGAILDTMEEDEIQKLKDEIQRLRKLVFYDDLTGVLNRRGFEEETGRIFHMMYYKRNERERRATFAIPFSIIFLDIDDFKKLNDTYGHAFGDIALKEVAAAVRRTVRDHDILGRLGGEEFVVALSGANREVAQSVAERIRQNIENIPLAHDGVPVTVTASIGVAARKEHGHFHDLVEEADQAMYQAKQTGKNKVVAKE